MGLEFGSDVFPFQIGDFQVPCQSSGVYTTDGSSGVFETTWLASIYMIQCMGQNPASVGMEKYCNEWG